MGRDAELRLLFTLALSAALHVSFIYGVAVGRSEPTPAHVILARLQPAADAPPQARRITAAHRAALRRLTAATPESQGYGSSSSAAPEPLQAAAVASVRDDSRAPAMEVPTLVDPTWYTARDLDLYPQALAPFDPPYPASVSGVVGEVTVLLSIDEFGVVQDSSVVTAQPAGYFEESALSAFRTARFAPAQRDGRPVRSRIVVKVRFAPQPT
jgi:periplasmic protein TonB